MKRWAIFLGILVLAGGIILGLFTNYAFQKLWLPWLGKKLEMQLTAREVDWKPLQGITLKEVSLFSEQGTTGWVEKIEVEYDLSAFKRGALAFTKIAAQKGQFQQEINFFKKKKNVSPESEKKSEVSLRRSATTGFQLESGPITFKDIRVTTVLPTWQGGKLAVVNDFKAVFISGYRPDQLTQIKFENEFSGQPTLSLEVKHALVRGELNLNLDADFKFRTGQGKITVTEVKGKSRDWSLEGYEIHQAFDLEPYRLKNFTILFLREGKSCGELKASGPVDFNLNTSDIIVTCQGVTPDLINPGLSLVGLQMNSGTVSASGQIQVLKESMRLQGEAKLEQSQFRRVGHTTALPVLDGKIAFNTEWFSQQNSLQVDQIQMDLTQDSNPFAEISLDNPIRVNWSERNLGNESATLNVKVHPTDVMLFQEVWQGSELFSLTSGYLEGQGQIVATRSGQVIHWKGQGRANQLNGRIKQWGMNEAKMEFDTEGDWKNFKNLDLNHLRFTLTENEKVQAEIKVQGKSDSQKGNFTTLIQGNLGELVPAFSQQLVLESGSLEGKIETRWNDPEAKETSFNFSSKNLRGSCSKILLENAEIICQGQLQKAGQEIALPQMEIKFFTKPNVPAGRFYVTGQHNRETGALKLEAELKDWTKDNLKPLLKLWGPQAQAGSLAGNFVYEKQGSIRLAKLDVQGEQILIPLSSSQDSFIPTNLKLAFNASGNQSRFEVSESFLELNNSKQRISLSGWLESREKFDLQLESQGIDLSALAGLLEKKAEQKVEKNNFLKSSEGVAPSLSSLNRTNLVVLTNQVQTNAILARGIRGNKFKNVDRKLTINLTHFLLPPYPQSDIQTMWVQKGKAFTLAPFEAKVGEGTIEGEWTGSIAGAALPFLMKMKCKNLSLEPWRNLVKPEFQPYLEGILDAEVNLSGTGSRWDVLQSSLQGKVNVTTRDAQFELIPAAQSFLKSAARYVSPEFAQTKFDSVSADFRVGSRKLKTDNLKLNGDLMRLAIQGELDFDQEIDLKVAFTGKKEVLERAQVKVGDFSIGGKTFITFGKTENGYTTLPGLLPVRGKLPDNIKADWDKWLVSVGASAAPEALQEVLNNLF